MQDGHNHRNPKRLEMRREGGNMTSRDNASNTSRDPHNFYFINMIFDSFQRCERSVLSLYFWEKACI